MVNLPVNPESFGSKSFVSFRNVPVSRVLVTVQVVCVPFGTVTWLPFCAVPEPVQVQLPLFV